MRTESPFPNKVQRQRKTYLLTEAMHRLETALARDIESPDYTKDVDHRLAHILDKLDGVWRGDRQIVIDKTRNCIETNSPTASIRTRLLGNLDRSQAA